MRNSLIKSLVFLAAISALGACNDPIFYTIAQEVAPVEPRIKGGPTNFAVFADYLFVASGNGLHWFNETYGWDKGDINVPKPGGKITYIASAGDYLYALCYKNQNSIGSTVIRRFSFDKGWEELGGDSASYDTIRSIYAAGNVLFIGAEKNPGAETNNFAAIFYVDENEANPSEAIKHLEYLSGDGLELLTGDLCGAVFDGTNVYLGTRGQGIYWTGNPFGGAAFVPDSTGIEFAGIVSLEDGANSGGVNTIVAITRKGHLHAVTPFGISDSIANMGGLATGALAVWRYADSPDVPRLLLAGRQDSLGYSINTGYTYGYLELELDENGVKQELNKDGELKYVNFREPGKLAPTSINSGDNERYTSTIGKHPVNYLFQAPFELDSEMTLFASTQKSGVWSYRGREWNAEE